MVHRSIRTNCSRSGCRGRGTTAAIENQNNTIMTTIWFTYLVSWVVPHTHVVHHRRGGDGWDRVPSLAAAQAPARRPTIAMLAKLAARERQAEICLLFPLGILGLSQHGQGESQNTKDISFPLRGYRPPLFSPGRPPRKQI